MNTAHHLPQELLSKLAHFMAAHLGLYFSLDHSDNLERRVMALAKEAGESDVRGYLERLLAAPVTEELLSSLAIHFTIGETYFFRDPKTWDFLQQRILPELIALREKTTRSLSIWSAGCATGEEAYTMAIIVSRLIPDLAKWEIKIVGSDINRAFLKRAKSAKYKKWSFRAMSKEMQQCYFNCDENEVWSLRQDIKKLVKFCYCNLADSSSERLLGPFDLILCNNVLIYFTPAQIAKVIRRFSEELNSNGILCVTPIEAPYVQDQELSPYDYGVSHIFKKGAVQQEPSLLQVSSMAAAMELSHGKGIEMPQAVSLHSSHSLPPLPIHVSSISDEVQAKVHVNSSLLMSRPKNEVRKDPDPMTLLEDHYRRGNYRHVVSQLENELSPLVSRPIKLAQRQKQMQLLTKAYANMGEHDCALIWCLRMLQSNPLDAIGHYLHATILQEKQLFSDAVQALKRALYLDPDLIIAHFLLGCLFSKLGNNKDKKRCFRNALMLLDQAPAEVFVAGTDDMTAKNLITIIEAQMA